MKGIRPSALLRAGRLWAFAVALILAMGLPAIALASVATYGSITPSPGSTTAVSKPTISVTVYDKYKCYGSGTMRRMWVDGTRVYPTITFVRGSASRRFKLTYNVRTPMSLRSHLVTVKIRDQRRRNSTYSWRFTVRDGSAPVTALSTTPAANAAGWHDTTATVTLSATDDAVSSGIANTYYTLNGGATTAYTAPFTISAEGSTTVQYWSVDGAGNIETAKTSTVKIDRTLPTIDALSLSQSSTTSSDPTLTVSVADALSGVADASFVLLTEYPFEGLGTFDSSTGVLTYKPLAPLAGGRSGVAVEAVDMAGNHSWLFGYVTIPPTATFDGNGGTPASSEATAAYNTALGAGMPGDPTRTGYTFSGWNTAEDGTGLAFNLGTLLIADITVYAQWTANPQTVTFNGNGGSPAETTVTTSYDATLGADMPANPTRDHYTFTSWNTAANGSGSTFTSATVITGDITVYAQWTIDTHVVTFNGNGGIPTESTVTASYNTTLGASMPDDPTRTGYTFGSWNTAANGSGSTFTSATVVTTDTTVYAQWTADPQTVTFNGNGGTPTSTDVVTSTDATLGADMPADPTRTGYAFTSWNTAANGSGSTFTSATVVTTDTTVYAQWTADIETVTFNGNGGSPASSTATASYDTTLGASMPDDPTRTGYTFGSWNTAANGSGSTFTSATVVTADVTVYAQWTADPLTVTFNGNGGLPATSTVIASTDATLGADMPADPTRTGYAFTSWNTAANGSGSTFTSATVVTTDTTVYAQWTIDIETVTFNGNGGSPASSTATASYDTTLGADMPADPTRTGYTFGSWNTAANGSGSTFTSATVVTADVTVYAQWTADPLTVTFNGNGGLPATSTVIASTDATLGADMPADPTRTGYAFTGWDTAADGSGSTFTSATVVTTDTTVYAQWAVTPTVTGLSPTSGVAAGGTGVVITGTGFTAGATVNFGANPATEVVVDSDTQITCNSPAGTAGIVDVTVTTAGGTSATSSSDQYTYN